MESQFPLGWKVCISALQFRKIWKVYVSASFKVESFEVCISTKEAMESEDMFATAENKMEGFDLQPVGLAAVQVQEEESFFDIVGTRSGRFAPLMLSRYSATNIR